MEPRQSEKSLESRSEVQTSLDRHPEPKRRFRIVKLEERIAPGGGPRTYYCNFGHHSRFSCGKVC
jgi:hypothetical protein